MLAFFLYDAAWRPAANQRRTAIQMGYPPAPDGHTIYVVGDIHGRSDLLENVHRRIDEDRARSRPAHPVEIYLGDYVDRGPDPAGVVARLIDRAEGVQTAFLRGNHEQLLIDFLDGADCLKQWSAVGAVSTLLSYGVTPELLSRRVAADIVRRRFGENMPDAHRRFYEDTGSYLLVEPYLFVHAGIRPGIATEKQSVSDLLTIRRTFLDFQGDFGHIVVHGHTPAIEPELRRNRINLDTGAFATSRLTCARIGADGVSLLEGDGWRMVERP